MEHQHHPYHRHHSHRKWCGCCDLKSAAMIAGTFVMTLSFAQFMLTFFQLVAYCVADSDYLGGLLKTVLGGYVGLACMDLLMLVLSIAMMDRNARQENKSVLLTWQIFLAIYVIYEAALNIAFFILTWPKERMDYGNPMDPRGSTWGVGVNDSTEAIMTGIIVYWLVKMGTYIACFMAVHWRWHELMHVKDATLARRVSSVFEQPAPMVMAPQPAVYQTMPLPQPAVQVIQQPSPNYVITQY